MDRRMTQKRASSKGAAYKHIQLFGYKDQCQKIQQEDIISTIKFDHGGQYIAIGDQAGRVIIFHNKHNPKQKDDQMDYFTEFQSHNKDFDPLRSMEVEETITGISWLSPQGKYLKLISTNSRTIKLWKIYQKNQTKVVSAAGRDLSMPKLQTTDSYYTAETQVSFPTKHLACINSISSSKNEQYLLSSDDVHCLLWNYQKYNRPYQLADLLGEKELEDVQENINFSKMHPTSDSLFLYGTNKGNLKLCDLRLSSHSDTSATNFKNQFSGQKNFLTDLLSSVSSADFYKQGKYIVTRDFLTVKLWDVCNSKKPVNTIMLNEGLKPKLSQMFQNQSIFDKFSVTASPDGNTLASGSYNNCFHLVDHDGINTQYELNYKKNLVAKQMGGKTPPLGKVDYLKKTTALDFHPNKNIVAVASLNCFFLYGM